MSASSVGRGGLPTPPGQADLPAAAMTVAGVARRLGVAPATLRTWDRRYGLGPTEHAAGEHRRYSPADVGRLEVMRRLVLEGVAPGDAARAALADVGASDAGETGEASPAPEAREPGAADDALATGSPAAGSTRGGGGQVVSIPGGSAVARGLARAAMALDAPAARAIIASSLDARGVVPTWDDLLLPVLKGVGARYEWTGRGVEVEHLLSEVIIVALADVTRGLTRPRNHQPVLLAAADEEQHTLPLHAVAAALAERHVASRMLGARVPRGALAAAVRRTGPIAVMLWAQVPGEDRYDELEDLPHVRPAPLVVVGGAGWAQALPSGIARVLSLDDAVTCLVAATLA